MPDLTPNQREVLLALVDLTQRCHGNYVRDIAQHAGLTMNQTTTALNALRKTGLATWTALKGWHPTPAGLAAAQTLAEVR